jgi:hypothetical protein
MRRAVLSIAILLTCCILPACDDADLPPTSPTAFKNELDVVRIAPASFPLASHCPSVAPFSVPFILNVTAGTAPLILSEVRIQPTNPFGRTSPPTIFDSASLTRQFGSVTVERFAVRQFPFAHPFFCDMTGSTLGVSVTTTDRSGMGRVSTLQVPVY